MDGPGPGVVCATLTHGAHGTVARAGGERVVADGGHRRGRACWSVVRGECGCGEARGPRWRAGPIGRRPREGGVRGLARGDCQAGPSGQGRHVPQPHVHGNQEDPRRSSGRCWGTARAWSFGLATTARERRGKGEGERYMLTRATTTSSNVDRMTVWRCSTWWGAWLGAPTIGVGA